MAEHSTSFDQLIDGNSMDLAMRYLDKGQVKLQELVLLLNAGEFFRRLQTLDWRDAK